MQKLMLHSFLILFGCPERECSFVCVPELKKKEVSLMETHYVGNSSTLRTVLRTKSDVCILLPDGGCVVDDVGMKKKKKEKKL